MVEYSHYFLEIYIFIVEPGVFNNPIETVTAALKALKEELQGINTTVFLQSRPFKPNVWKKVNTDAMGIKLQTLNDWQNKNS